MTVEFHLCGETFGLSAPETMSRALEDAHDAVVYLGTRAVAEHRPHPDRRVVLVELANSPLGVATGEHAGVEGDNRVGLARFRLGSEWRDLVELVIQPGTDAGAVLAARRLVEDGMGMKTAVCRDRPGRILDRLVRPYYNAALRGLDEELATAGDLDKTVRLGLGYPEGPVELLERTGLADHFRVSRQLWEQLGEPGYLPARRAQVAWARSNDE
jgi:3-hydroxybutyryl-CoA dehydrogenase